MTVRTSMAPIEVVPTEQTPQRSTPEKEAARAYVNSLDPLDVLAILHRATEVSKEYEDYRKEAGFRDASALKLHRRAFDLNRDFEGMGQSMRCIPSPQEIVAQAQNQQPVGTQEPYPLFEARVVEVLHGIDDPRYAQARARIGSEALQAAKNF